MKICIVYAHDELISDTKNLCAELVNRYDAQVRFFPSILKSELDDLSGYDAVILLYNPRDLPDLEDFIDEIKAQVVLGSWLPIMATRCHEDVSDIERFWPFRHMIYSDPGALANKIGRLLREHQRTPDESLLRGDAQPSPNGLSELEMLGFSGLRRGYLAPKRPGVVEQSPWLEVKLENFQPLSRHDVSEAMPPMAGPPRAGSSLLTQLAVVAAVVGFAQAIGYWDEITAWFASLLKALFHSAMPPLPAPSAPPPQASEALVDVSAYAPPRVRKGTQFLVQVFVHDPAQEREAATLAKEADFKAVRRGIATLDVEIAIGERLDFMLEAGGLTISKPLQGLVWRGTPQSRSFIVTVPQDFAGESAIICVQVLRQSVPIGQISFSMELVADVAAPTPGFGAMSAVDRSDWPLEPMGDAARRFRRAFLSYASPDRLEVVRLARMLPAVHMEFFQDLLSLEPGEEWESRLYREIEDCDLFLLFWSNAARKSIWVNKELDHALEYARKAGSDRPKIQPVLIEGPPPPDPPEALPHLHFNDPNLYMVFALERLAEKHPAN